MKLIFTIRNTNISTTFANWPTQPIPEVDDTFELTFGKCKDPVRYRVVARHFTLSTSILNPVTGEKTGWVKQVELTVTEER